MRYKKILLVSFRFCRGKFQLSIHPLAGLGYIAEALLRAGFSVEVLDMNLQYKECDLRQKIVSFQPDIIGFTVMTFGYRQQYDLINRIKQAYPEIDIVAGGPHISTLREKALQDCAGIDYGIVLEGDASMVDLCRGVEKRGIPGLIYHKEGDIVCNDFFDFITDLDALEFPKYETFELNKYPVKQIGIVTSRGCPYDCIYCPVVAAIGKKFRQRSAVSVVNEIDYWYNKGYRQILILDDNFTLSRRRVELICGLLGKRHLEGISLKCPNGIRADRVDYALLSAMREVGFDMVSFGVEAAKDDILKNLKKAETTATIEKSISDACKLGFDVDLFFLVGSPGERLSDVESSFSLALRYPVRSAKFYNIIPFLKTELFEWIEKHNYFLYPVDDILNNASHFVNVPCFFTPEMSACERKKAFVMSQRVSRKIRARYLERRLKGPVIFKRTLSQLYSFPLLDRLINNNAFIVRLKEQLKKRLVGGSTKGIA